MTFTNLTDNARVLSQSNVQTTGRIDSIQLLRGLAATLVAGFHLWAAADQSGYHSAVLDLFRHGEAGVDIFFVISGFVIVYSVENRGGTTLGEFARARFWRILPPYWAVLTLYVLLAALLYLLKIDSGAVPSLFQLCVSYFLLPYPDHIIPIAWTLSLEVLFYAVFGLIFLRFGKVAFIAVMMLWALAAQMFSHAFTVHPEWLVIGLHTAVLEFLLGAVIAFAFLRGATPLQLPVLLLGTVLLLLHLGDVLVFGSREIMPGLPAAMIVYGLLGVGWRLPRLVILWGEASYLLYLSHLLIYAVLGNLLRMVFDVDVYHSLAAMAGLLLIAIVASCLATKYIEQPYQRWYKRRKISGG